MKNNVLVQDIRRVMSLIALTAALIPGGGCSKENTEKEELPPNVPRAASRPASLPALKAEIQPPAPPTAPRGGPHPGLAGPPQIATTQGGVGPSSRTALNGPQGLVDVKGERIELPSGLAYIQLKAGTGPRPKSGQEVIVDYTGWLKDGTMFDSSRTRPTPFSFQLGTHQVIAGWDEGVATMKVGEQRRLIVPGDLGYGASGSPPKIPANATLIFDVELLGIK